MQETDEIRISEGWVKKLLEECMQNYIESLEYGGGQWITKYVEEFLQNSKVWNGRT